MKMRALKAIKPTKTELNTDMVFLLGKTTPQEHYGSVSGLWGDPQFRSRCRAPSRRGGELARAFKGEQVRRRPRIASQNVTFRYVAATGEQPPHADHHQQPGAITMIEIVRGAEDAISAEAAPA
jgi:hypothetical protein